MQQPWEVPGCAITVEVELDDTGAVTRLAAQPFGIFRPKT